MQDQTKSIQLFFNRHKSFVPLHFLTCATHFHACANRFLVCSTSFSTNATPIRICSTHLRPSQAFSFSTRVICTVFGDRKTNHLDQIDAIEVISNWPACLGFHHCNVRPFASTTADCFRLVLRLVCYYWPCATKLLLHPSQAFQFSWTQYNYNTILLLCYSTTTSLPIHILPKWSCYLEWWSDERQSCIA